MWLETVVLIEAMGAFWLSILNVLVLARMVAPAKRSARRVAALVLAFVCAGQAMEALLFLSQGEASPASAALTLALLVVRSALVVSAALVSLLLLRGLWLRRV
jgi:hypothetical protein